jgi:hypothetical protein
VRSLEGRDEPFLIAELSSEEYMQILWTQEGWLVEVREGDADHHYQAQGLGPDSAISALVSYDRGENNWRKLKLEPVRLE